MKIDVIKLHGFTTFRDPAELNLAGLGPGLIAIAGPNGAGKSTLLEAIPGAIYRQAPSRGNIADLATSRESTIEVVGENGDPFRILLSVDSQNGKSEALLFDGAGEPIAGPKVRDFDRIIAERFPPLSVYLAAAFSCQTGAGSMMKMERAERRELFGRLLGLDHLEDLAGAARERARQVESELTAARAALEAVKAGAGDVTALEDLLRLAQEKAAYTGIKQQEAAEVLRVATADCRKIEETIAEAERAAKTAMDARTRAKRAEEALARLDRQFAGLESVLKDAPRIRDHAAELVKVAAEMERIRAEGVTASIVERSAFDLATQRTSETAAATRAYENTQRESDDAARRIKESRRQIELAKQSTGDVPCSGILQDQARAGCRALVGHFKTRDKAQRELNELLGGGDDLESALTLAGQAHCQAAAKLAQANAARQEACDLAEKLRAAYRSVREKHAELLKGDRSAVLARAEAEAGALKPNFEAARAAAAGAAEDAAKATAAVPKVDFNALSVVQDVALIADEDVRGLAKAAQAADREVALLEAGLKTAKETELRVEEIRAKLEPLEQDLADWRCLARGLGREGVQALELDAAGPRVSELTNELLADAYGSRFQVRLDTQAAKADGKGVKETFDIVVVDNERGREGSGEDLSGGEKVIVGEALGLAVGLFHAQASGINLGTVCRDETVGALDPENAERYLAMLRSFLRVGRVHQLIFVAHSPQLIDLADAVVRVEDGRIEVRQ